MMSNAHGRKHMRNMNNARKKLETRTLTALGFVPNTGIINCWNANDRTANPIPAGENMGAVRVGIASRFTRVVCAKCNR